MGSSTSDLEALRLAVELHADQGRKTAEGEPDGPSYIGHILGVAAAVIDSGGNADQTIAALLHDAVEDTLLTVNDIRVMFGDRVASIVDACTDAYGMPKPPWGQRKDAYVEHLRTTGDVDVLLVTAADKLRNARAMLRDHAVIGDSLWAVSTPTPTTAGTTARWRAS
jgi:(p)ppGpp synthase/HD superfamily hydrolase